MNLKKICGLVALVLAVTAGIAFAVKRNQPATQTASVHVVASFYPLYDFATEVGGAHVSVTNITPPGAEPHDYEPAPQALVGAQQSNVFVYDGGTMEPWVSKFLGDYHNVAIKASTGIALHVGTVDGVQNAKDPHFWLDPVLAQQIVRTIRDGLIKADPNHRVDYTKNAANYITQLQKLDRDYQAGLANCTQHTIITSHDAFSYLADRYGFTSDAIAGLSPDEEPSAGKLAELSQLARTDHINYIFFESLVSPRLADTIAREVGAKTIVFDPLEGLTNVAQKEGKNYVSVQRDNLANLRTALACR
ncbi:MAG: metal ABC transporter solute-binding protein, Zn/Mn family [Candidatus Saccharibacteria bacterium]